MKNVIAFFEKLSNQLSTYFLLIAAFIFCSIPVIAQHHFGTYKIVNTYPGKWQGASLSWDGGASHPMASVEFNDPVEWILVPVAGKQNTFIIVNTYPGEWQKATLSWDGGPTHPMSSVEFNDLVEWRLDPVPGKQNTYKIVNTFPGKWQGASLSWDEAASHPMASVEFNDPVEWRLDLISTNRPSTSITELITAEAYWWGYHFVIPEVVMKELSKSTDIMATIMGLGGATIAMSGGTLAPVVGFAATYIAAQFQIMKHINQGKGVYLSATWLTPTLLIPTAVTE